jgi:AraC-like DNA-binding protein
MPPRIVLQSWTATPLGAIRLAGFIEDSRGDDQGSGRRLGSYALVLSLRGRCAYWDERNGSRAIGPGEGFLLFPDVRHRYRGAGPTGWDEFFLVFDGPVFDCWRAQGLISPDRPFLRLHPVSYWLARLRACLDPGGMAGRAAALRQICALQAALVEALAVTEGAAATGDRPWLARACSALAEPGAQALPLAGLAKDLGMPFETFRKRFAAAMGMSPGAYRTARLIDEAGRLLATSTLSGRAIAERLGFSDEHYFSRRFRQLAGMTPTDFRRRVASRGGARPATQVR